jgi:hypothetical protein
VASPEGGDVIFAGIDVNIITHEKLSDACEGGDLAPFGLWTFGMCYSQLHETNGRLARSIILTALGGRRNVVLAKKLVDAGLWTVNEDGSWQVWNYGKKNQSADEIRDKKAKSAERVKAWRDRRNAAGNANVTPRVTRYESVRTDPEPEPDNTTRKQDLIGTASPPLEPVTRIGRRKPETACPPSEASAGELRDWAERWKIPDGHGEFVAFLDHHRKGDARWRDWAAAWRTWLKNAPKFAGRGSFGAPRQQIGSAATAAWMNPTENFDFGAKK